MIFKIKTFKDLAVVILGVVLIASFVVSCCIRTVGHDAYYYIGVTKLILQGDIPFLNFHLDYTPLSFYLMCIPIKLFGASLTVIAFCSFFLHLTNTFLLYRLTRSCVASRKVCAIFCVMYLSLCYILDGHGYILEPYVTFWGLSSLLFAKKEKWVFIVLSGVCCAFSFLSKQYGLGYIVLLSFFYYFCSKKNRKKLCPQFLLWGTFLTIVSFYVFYLLLHGGTFNQLIATSGSDYQKNGIFSLLRSYGIIFCIMPILIMAMVIYIRQKLYKKNIINLAVLGMSGFMLATYVRSYPHYYQLALPFCIMIMVLIHYYMVGEKNKQIYSRLVYLTLFISFILIVCKDIRAFPRFEKQRLEDQATKLSLALPIGSRNVFVDLNSLELGLINDYYPPLLEKYGLSNGFVESESAFRDLVFASDYCLLSVGKDASINARMEDVAKYLKENFIRTEVSDSRNRCFAIVYTKDLSDY